MIGSLIRAVNGNGDVITGVVVKEFEETTLAFMVGEDGKMFFMECPKEGENVIHRQMDLESIKEGMERLKELSQK